MLSSRGGTVRWPLQEGQRSRCTAGGPDGGPDAKEKRLEERVKRFILSIVLMAALVAIALPQANTGQLATAIQEGKHAAALEMIRAGADVNEAQPDGTRPIHWAVYRVDYDLMDALIAKKAKVDVTNEFGSTPLAEATKQGNPRMVK